MIISAQQTFSDGQVVNANAASTNIIDLGATGTVLGAPAALKRDIGKGNPIPIVVQFDAAATGTSPTLDVTVQVDDNSGFSSAKTVATATQVAGGAAGQRVNLYYIPEGTDERYLRVFYTVGGTSPVYTVSAFIPKGDQTSDRVPGV